MHVEELNRPKTSKKTNEIKEKVFGIFTRRASLARQPDRCLILGESDQEVPNNKISTSKYTNLTFLPKNLLIQLQKAPNLYFIMMGVWEMIPQISYTGGFPLVYMPLSLIILISMIKDFFEDKGRRQADYEENNQMICRLDGTHWTNTKSEDLHIGDIVKIQQDQYFPADMILLNSSHRFGVVHIETKNLDGETNLKQVRAHDQLQALFEQGQLIRELEMKSLLFEYERPNSYMYKFVGHIKLPHPAPQTLNFDSQSLLKKGTSLKNTEYCCAMVVYTGHDTKIMLNSIQSTYKFSIIEKQLNFIMILLFSFILLFCFLGALLFTLEEKDYQHRVKDVFSYGVKAKSILFFYKIPEWLLLISNMVPISLLVTMELVKFLQSQILRKDNLFYCRKVSHGLNVNSSNLLEQLGQITHIVTDKTGTLTSNLMKFKCLTAGSFSYGEGPQLSVPPNRANQYVDFRDKQFFKDFDRKKGPQYDQILRCLTCLNLCHSVFAEEEITRDGGDSHALEKSKQPDPTAAGGSSSTQSPSQQLSRSQVRKEIVYNAQSPDEYSLLQFTQQIGFQYMGVRGQGVSVIYDHNTQQEHTYQVLRVLDFNFVRKRMSVVCRSLSDQSIVLFCKGADNVLIDLTGDARQVETQVLESLKSYSEKGLRTLCLGQKFIEEDTFRVWSAEYEVALQSFDARRQDRIESLQQQLETGLRVIGATGILDMLSENVHETITQLRQAGLKTWMMTGDKIETAINIAYNCGIIRKNSNLKVFHEESVEEVQKLLEKEYAELEKYQHAPAPAQEQSLVVSGPCFQKIYHDKELFQKFIQIVMAQDCVIGARTTPHEKQIFVKIIKNQDKNAMVLAIGDGANDVSMINESHIGVGILGLEGREAAKASDIAIGQFKHLRRLLLYHGYEIYRKNSNVIYFNFYKNILNRFIIYWYGIWSFFSATNIYNQLMITLYNLIFTSLPIIIYALFDETLPAEEHLTLEGCKQNALEFSPQIYQMNIKDKVFSFVKFVKIFFLTLCHSMIITILIFFGLDNCDRNGHCYDLILQGMVAMMVSVIVSNVLITQMHRTHCGLSIFVQFGSIGVFILFFLVTSGLEQMEHYRLFTFYFRDPNIYIVTALGVGVVHFTYSAINRIQFMEILDRIQQFIKIYRLNSQELNSNRQPDKMDPDGNIQHDMEMPFIQIQLPKKN